MKYVYRCQKCQLVYELDTTVENRDNPNIICCGTKPKRVVPQPGLKLWVPISFHTSWSDIAPKTEKEVQEWKKYAKPVKSRWV